MLTSNIEKKKVLRHFQLIASPSNKRGQSEGSVKTLYLQLFAQSAPFLLLSLRTVITVFKRVIKIISGIRTMVGHDGVEETS